MSDIHALSGAYAVDALDDLERAGFERHLAECAACRAEVASLREAAAALADDTALAPPPELRAAVLDGITRVRPLPPVTAVDEQVDGPSDRSAGEQTDVQTQGPTVGGGPRARRWFPALVAAAVLAILGIGAAVWQPWQEDTSTTVTTAQRVLQDPDAQRVEVAVKGGGTATVVRSEKENRAVMVAEGMPAAPDGKVYQLWLQTPSEDMVSAGLVPAGADTVLLDGDADDAIAAGLSLEPAGGSEQPTDVLALFDFGTA